MALDPAIPVAPKHAGAKFALLRHQFQQDAAEVGGVTDLELDMGEFRHPADRRRDHLRPAGQRLDHAHRPAFVEGRYQHVVERAVVVGQRRRRQVERGAGPALPGEGPLDLRDVHHLRDESLALAAGVVGATDHADAQLRRERFNIHAGRDGGDRRDARLAQRRLVEARVADRMLDLARHREEAVMRLAERFEMREIGDLHRREAAAAAGEGHVVLDAGGRVGAVAKGHVGQVARQFLREPLQDPAPVGGNDVDRRHATVRAAPARPASALVERPSFTAVGSQTIEKKMKFRSYTARHHNGAAQAAPPLDRAGQDGGRSRPPLWSGPRRLAAAPCVPVPDGR
jgi:hypothetical protein